MTITCKLGDIKEKDMIWNLIGSDSENTEQIEVKPADLSEGLKAFEHKRLFEYNFKIMIPKLKGFFKLAYEKEVAYPTWKFIGDFIHFYETGSDKPCYVTSDDLYSTVKYIVSCSTDKTNVDVLECIIEVPDEPENLYHCKLYEANHILFYILYPDVYPIEMIKTDAWPEYEFYMFNLTVEVPSLGIYFTRHTDRSLKPQDWNYGDYFDLIQEYHMYSVKTDERLTWDTDVDMTELTTYIFKDMTQDEIDQLDCCIHSPYPAEIFDQFLPGVFKPNDE